MAKTRLYLNVALETDFPSELETAFKNGDQEAMSIWAMDKLQKLIDGEDPEIEFGVQLLSLSVKASRNG